MRKQERKQVGANFLLSRDEVQRQHAATRVQITGYMWSVFENTSWPARRFHFGFYLPP